VNSKDDWIILDTETTGLRAPIYPIEIGAQRMRGWSPCGEAFRILIDFDKPIEPEAEKLHGYSRAFLSQNGKKPETALASFAEYAGKSPLVAYNLDYDWKSVLKPAYTMLGISSSLKQGFCALKLVSVLIHGLPNRRLKTVMETFNLSDSQKHNALDDVRIVVRLLEEIIGPHLEACGIRGFKNVAKCAKGKTDVRCIELLARNIDQHSGNCI
jgi:DNA polymerase III subunit epsilon